MDPDHPVFDHTHAPDSDANDWFRNAVEEICAPYLAQIRPPERTYETQPPMTDTAAPDAAYVQSVPRSGNG